MNNLIEEKTTLKDHLTILSFLILLMLPMSIMISITNGNIHNWVIVFPPLIVLVLIVYVVIGFFEWLDIGVM